VVDRLTLLVAACFVVPLSSCGGGDSKTNTASGAAAMIFLLVRTYRGGDWLENAGWATCAVIVTTTWFLPWYLIWFLPLAALALKPYQRLTTLALTGLAIGLQLPLIFGK
jgi:hypothetical protein